MTIERARAWHLLTTLVCAASLVLQFYLSAANKNTQVSPFTVGTRIGNFFCYFTIQSNLIVLAAAIALVLVPDRRGTWWPAALLDALLCITVTCLVDVVVLRPQVHLGGWSNVADIGLHILTPILMVAGWLLFGPRPRLAWATLGWATIYPLAWVAFTLIRGRVVNWYPYPFIDVSTHGYARVTLNVALVAVLFLVLGVAFVWLDRKLPRAPVQP